MAIVSHGRDSKTGIEDGTESAGSKRADESIKKSLRSYFYDDSRLSRQVIKRLIMQANEQDIIRKFHDHVAARCASRRDYRYQFIVNDWVILAINSSSHACN